MIGVVNLALPAMGKPRSQPTVQQRGTPLLYFRVERLDQCNVYMNYSYVDEPKFQLRVLNPFALTPGQAAFVDKFNSAFATMIRNHPDACSYSESAYLMSAQDQQTLMDRCFAQEKAMGYSESGWPASRLPAPSNCISFRDDPPGALNLLPKSLPVPVMTIEAWMVKANSGR